ncbi:MAG: zf-HC2 domain-containing protein [Longimicrobiales bacterium]
MNHGSAGRLHDVVCDEFVAGHSEYVDGLLSPPAAARLAAHAAACAACARYDRVVRKGRDLVRDLPDAQPSNDFELRLQHRIFHLEDADVLQPRTGGAAAALGVAAVIALLAWSPMLVVPDAGTAAASFEQAAPAYFASDAVPLFTQSAWYPMTMPAAPAHQTSATLAMFPGPYSPLIVTPPAHRSVRPVSAGYVPFD